MAELDQTSMPQFKRCYKCDEIKSLSEFPKRKDSLDGHRNICRKCHYIYHGKPFEHTEKGRAARKRSKQSPNAIMWRYRFAATEHRKEYMRQYNKRYFGEHTNYYKEWYHNLQDIHGCHRTVRDWYPAARFLEALETATIEDIEL